jgi:O-acetylserine/cysteine efflux transporter
VKRSDIALGVLVAVLWGLNFVAIDAGLDHLPPLFFVTLRYLLAVLPLILFVPRPDVGWRTVVAVGVFGCVLQFGLLFLSIDRGLPAGLSSVVIQCQVPFTVALAVPLLGERVTRRQAMGIGIALIGIACIGVMRSAAIPVSALLLCLGAAAAWGVSNVVTRASGSRRPLSLLVYSSAAAVPPLLLGSVLLEGPTAGWRALGDLAPESYLALAYVVVAATWVGFGLWLVLLGRYHSSVVSPFALLAPPVGLIAAWLMRGEQPSTGELLGCLLALVGLVLVAAPRRQRRPRRLGRNRSSRPCARAARAAFMPGAPCTPPPGCADADPR